MKKNNVAEAEYGTYEEVKAFLHDMRKNGFPLHTKAEYQVFAEAYNVDPVTAYDAVVQYRKQQKAERKRKMELGLEADKVDWCRISSRGYAPGSYTPVFDDGIYDVVCSYAFPVDLFSKEDWEAQKVRGAEVIVLVLRLLEDRNEEKPFSVTILATKRQRFFDIFDVKGTSGAKSIYEEKNIGNARGICVAKIEKGNVTIFPKKSIENAKKETTNK